MSRRYTVPGGRCQAGAGGTQTSGPKPARAADKDRSGVKESQVLYGLAVCSICRPRLMALRRLGDLSVVRLCIGGRDRDPDSPLDHGGFPALDNAPEVDP
jgi:hypothetical protein